MTRFQGFKTKAEAQAYIKQNGKGSLCYEKSFTEPHGKDPDRYKECVMYGGLSTEYPYAVTWHEGF